jgi:hypothetical protein
MHTFVAATQSISGWNQGSSHVEMFGLTQSPAADFAASNSSEIRIVIGMLFFMREQDVLIAELILEQRKLVRASIDFCKKHQSRTGMLFLFLSCLVCCSAFNQREPPKIFSSCFPFKDGVGWWPTGDALVDCVIVSQVQRECQWGLYSISGNYMNACWLCTKCSIPTTVCLSLSSIHC